MRNIKACLSVRPQDCATLARLIADGKTVQKLVARARIVLLSGRGLGTSAIQRAARVSKPTVWRWQAAYLEGGVERLLKDKGKGPCAGKTPVSDAVRLAIVTKTGKETPANATHWSVRTMAEEMGVGYTTVQRIWKAHGLKPHLTRTFKLSNDPKFAKKVVDVVGLYLNPPDKENKTFAGLPLQDRLAAAKVEPRCAVYVIDTRTGDVAHWLRIEGVVNEHL
jgi:transposase